ncbi:nuclear transport factor 2 family protein [Sphingomonas sp. PB4P5]|uniref:nuclear transport factor 2 family protein n=1 Tax=Parasphingomonas puruogangriensis TaxID=3096155 RepID=UPI003FA69356
MIEEIERREDERFAAVMAGDAKALAPLLHQDLRYVHSSGAVQDRAHYLAELENGTWTYRDVRRSEQNISIRGGTAIVVNRLNISVLHLGKVQEVHSTALAIWVREAVGWQLFAVQSTAL